MKLYNRGRLMAATGLISFAIPVYAHAILLSSTPGLKAIVHGPALAVRLQFNSRVDSKRSMLKLVGPDGSQRVLIIRGDTSPNVLGSDVEGLGSGSYVLRWQVLARDGHITTGEVQFRIT